ncbi:nose resistant to fluoxetine protein 6-like [Formica exsecta]|uniref:nose resistant to fluoxetine protein 6-like n=1 Tax=Formica exsecta TaxID=72781 RepID=UPI00114166DC|nr:nose resistant to fluoxetine protein 6-like [Formica exsecta]
MSYRLFLSSILCILCTNLATLYHVSAQIDVSRDNDINSRTIPAYAVALRADLLNSTICEKELKDFRDAVEQRILWSLKMLDSSGGVKSGFLYGNNYWLGINNQCFDTMNTDPLELLDKDLLNNTLYRDPQKEFPPFEVTYFVAYFRHNSTLQYHVNLPNEDLITLGLCLPASCSISELSFILERIFRDRTFLINDLYSMDFKLIEVKDVRDDHQWLFSGAMLLICIVLAVNISMMIIGTAYDILVYQKYLNTNNKTTKAIGENTPEEMEMAVSSHRKNRIGEVLICFSVYTNSRAIFNTKIDSEAMPVIHGLKFLSMVWVIMAHTSLYSMDYLDNKAWSWRVSKGLPIQVLTNSHISVDTFFFISGFLVAYLYLKNVTGKGRIEPINYRAKLNEFFVSVIRRYIRLTPASMMMVGILQLNSGWYSETSQFYMDERPHETCAKYWWRNLLYINNLFNRRELCMSWSWYLANDMQFFIIAITLLILSTIYFYTAALILVGLLIGSIVLSGYISYIYEYVPILSELYRLIDVLYYPPWVRIGPYIIGIIAAYILIRLNKRTTLKRTTLILCWCLGSACNIFVLFGLYNRRISVLSSAIYVALNRTVWAIGIAWIVIVCSTKHGGIIKQVLSFKVWIPLSRLTYCAYLLNPFIIHSIHLHDESSTHLEYLSLGTMFMGQVVITYFCAYALSLMAEAPFIMLMRMLVQSRSKRKCRRNEIIISHTKL